MPLSLLIGLRFSRGRRRGGMVSLISVISTIGIALGVAVLIVGLSAMNGFERELNNRILAVVPHGEIEAVDSRGLTGRKHWITCKKCRVLPPLRRISISPGWWKVARIFAQSR